ncbi:MAG: hypothetical protein IPF79_04910 [Ignavibacteria bacterium]|nr:hypothetical protein [Ignavibacteria bacterium]
MNKKSMTEADVQRQFVTPVLVGVNRPDWDPATQIGLTATTKKRRMFPTLSTLMIRSIPARFD